jgi:hypothetical protein
MKATKLPSPLKERICACGCENGFQPKRRDQVYYNSIHANHGYNHGKRKKRDPNSSRINKLIRKNDNILRLFFEHKNPKNNLPELSSLYDAGLQSGLHIGKKRINEELFNCMYNFRYCTIKEEGKVFVQIEKL